MVGFNLEKGFWVNNMVCFFSLRSGTLFLLWSTLLISFHISVAFSLYAVLTNQWEYMLPTAIFISPMIISAKGLIHMPKPKENCNVDSVAARSLLHFINLYELLILLIVITGMMAIFVATTWYQKRLKDYQSLYYLLLSIIVTGIILHFVAVLRSYYANVTTTDIENERIQVLVVPASRSDSSTTDTKSDQNDSEIKKQESYRLSVPQSSTSDVLK